ncbi:unnamed protein product [Gemmata massiliana]|uniref:Uncharacterized protein n=1 Tax=Gemmata massiliana TaxID=1210884 RepID=A0A6P2DE00_9BACT|nr:hypothetical protein [Gemmata massiliana]VTS00396.1 unnamed protein product [Gemmata massiliana]
MGMKELLVRTGEAAAAGIKQVAADLAPHARGGMLDLQNAIVHAFPDSQRQEAVLGMPGVPTSSEVDFEGRVAAAARQPEREPELGMER